MYFSITVCMTTYPPTEGLEAAAESYTSAEVWKVPSPESGDIPAKWAVGKTPVWVGGNRSSHFLFSDFVCFMFFFGFWGRGWKFRAFQHGIFFTPNRIWRDCFWHFFSGWGVESRSGWNNWTHIFSFPCNVYNINCWVVWNAMVFFGFECGRKRESSCDVVPLLPGATNDESICTILYRLQPAYHRKSMFVEVVFLLFNAFLNFTFRRNKDLLNPFDVFFFASFFQALKDI